jgi:hypothetical protein
MTLDAKSFETQRWNSPEYVEPWMANQNREERQGFLIEPNYNARRRFIMLQKIFDNLSLEPERLGLWWVSASEGPRYSKVTEEFSEKIKSLGPSPVHEEIFHRYIPFLQSRP